jgi:hypothetical protein
VLFLTIWPAFCLTDDEIRMSLAAIHNLAAHGSPRLAAPALLHAATVVQPYLPDESRRLLAQASDMARANPEVILSPTDVRLWMKLDPDGGESTLRKMPNQGNVLDALAGYTNNAARAAEAIQTDLPGALTRELSWRLLGASQPRRAVALFGQAVEATTSPRRVMEAARALVAGLLEAEAQSPTELMAAVALFRESRAAAAASSEFSLTLNYELDSGRIITRSNAETLAAWQELLATPRGRATLRKALTGFTYLSGNSPPPVDAGLPLDEAMRRIRTGSLYPPTTQIGELWRYLVGKPRTEAEVRPIVAALVDWAEKSPDARDPFWFLRSLLNLDGHGPRWELPPALRTTVFAAAARLGYRVQHPFQLQEFAEAMVAEHYEPPAGSTSAELQYRIAKLAAALESRFDFALPTLDGARTIKLSSLRGKTVALAFWRSRMPLPTLPHGLDAEKSTLLAITDHPGDQSPGGGSTVTVLVDRDRRVHEHYRVMSLPRTIVLDGTGRIAQDIVWRPGR